MAVRKDIWTLEPNDPIIIWYRRAVGVMKGREAGHTNSWTYQAAIHGIAEAEGLLFNQCQHGGWYFLPWHRMYLLRMEEILRAAIKAEGGPAEEWALPYWNYGLGGENATLPLPFRDPEVDGEENHLYVAEREPWVNEGLEFPPAAVSAVGALERPAFVGAAEFGGGVTEPIQFAGAYGAVELTPHNSVHSEIGGLMGDPDTAALDPIFWLHHANIDRLWHVWKEIEGHHDPGEAQWTGQGFELFDAAGAQVTMTCGQVMDTTALGYEYDPKAPAGFTPFNPLPPVLAPEKLRGIAPVVKTSPHMVGATDKPIVLVGERVDVEIPIDAKEAGELDPAQHVYMNSENVEGDANPNVVYGIYVDLPADASPETTAAAHVGNLAFFGIQRTRKPLGDAHAHGFRFAADITSIAQRLAANGKWGGHSLSVTIKPLHPVARRADQRQFLPDPKHPEIPITIGRISVFYDA